MKILKENIEKGVLFNLEGRFDTLAAPEFEQKIMHAVDESIESEEETDSRWRGWSLRVLYIACTGAEASRNGRRAGGLAARATADLVGTPGACQTMRVDRAPGLARSPGGRLPLPSRFP